MIFEGDISDPDADESGTVGYSPPERLNESSKLSPVVDTWAVGVILYIMLTGGMKNRALAHSVDTLSRQFNRYS